VRKVLLVDDHPVVREGIARILAMRIPGLQIAEAEDGPRAVEQLRQTQYDLVLLDLTLPGDSGLSLLRRLRREFAVVPILVVSMHPADQFAQRALQAGAAGYVAKDSDPEEVVRAVSTALSGGRHVPAELQEAARLEEAPPPHGALSDREYQVLRMIGAGRTVSEIGTELGLSVKTVSTYRGRILEKLQLRTSAELIHYAVINKLVS
jgi:two-component system, NarL family, invasion response regulator UvrY